MPVRVATQQSATSTRVRGGSTSNSRSLASNIARTNDWDQSDALLQDGLHKISSSADIDAESASSLPSTELPRNNAATQFTPSNRRRQSSIQSQKGPMGPRPLDVPTGKRSFTNGGNPYPSTSTPVSGDIHGRQESINSTSRFSFASIAAENHNPWRDEKNFDFTRDSHPVNFDDFHSNITSTEPSLSQFPRPVASTDVVPTLDDTSTIPRPVSKTGSVRKAPVTGSIGRAGSLKRQPSTSSSTASRKSSTSDSMQAPAPGPVLRSRRQSHFPPNSFNNTGSNPTPRAPRKSIGPNTFAPPDSAENAPPKRRPSVSARKSVVEQEALESAAQRNYRSWEMNGETSKTTASGRTFKTKSLQPHGRQNGNELLTPSRTPDHSRSASSNQSQTPGRTSGRTGTPSSSANKRMSVLPHHATGLGARTISPTDARRLKRLSMMPHAPPVPSGAVPPTLPTPQPETLPRPQSIAQSPAVNARKSVTPSSCRTTPDPNRKSYSSGQSLSSSTSYNSARNSIGLLPRLPQVFISSSRLPTPKPRLETSNSNESEEVPPVPAIPKAYESPASEMEQAFFFTHSSSGPRSETPVSASPTVESLVDTMAALETPRNAGSATSSRKTSVVSDTELKSKPIPKIGKRGLQPLRLPPINLLPLSTPTAAKIMSLENVASPDDRVQTPSSRHTNTKTPSTPMTASRVNFPSAIYNDDERTAALNIRSSSSHHALRSDFDTHAAAASKSNVPFSFGNPTSTARTISPFVSSSLPKSNGEFASYMQPNHSGEFKRQSVYGKPSGPRAPSFSIPRKPEEKQALGETESPFSASAIRRKLSMTRRRSTSRARESAEAESDAKYNSMPPPKLPASATLGNLATGRNSPTSKQTYLKSRRKTSASSILVVNGDSKLQAEPSPRIEGRPSIESNRSLNCHPNRSSSLISPVPSVLSSQSGGQSRAHDVGLDRDDLIAEEEMRKLASKRKDAEANARELDSLRRRACPKDPASPLHALHAANLNIFEKGEVVDYEDVYFTGARSTNKIVGTLDSSATNSGYDDERGDYNIVNGDHLAYRYEVVDLLGKGSFGQVVRCIDHKTGILVAVKIIRNKKRFHQQALVEVNILQKLREWDPDNQHSVVNFDQSFYFRGHLCISTDLLDMNLYEFIKAHDFRGFSLKIIRRFTKQLLSSLVLLNSHKVIHCDLKPENVLLAHPMHSEIKVIDFGSSCFDHEKVYTYIQSRFYRSPEVILGMSYGMPIDIWSLGCILAELYTGYPIFPGENEQEQLACIMEVFGPPEKHLIEKSSRKKLFFDSMGKPRLIVSSKGRRRRPSSKELRQVLKCEDEAFLDFITKCLRWDPLRRINPHQAMMHEFVTGVKLNNRRTQAISSASSPVKRVGSTTASTARPLPQLPVTNSKNGVIARQAEVGARSPSKPTTKRLSTASGLQPFFQPKRASHVPPMVSGSTAPKVIHGQGNVSGRPDLAAAAAAAAASLRL